VAPGRSAHRDTFARDNLPPLGSWPELIFSLPGLRYPEVLNCAFSLLDRWVEEGFGYRRCLLTDTETWSYGQVQARANQLANVLVGDVGLVPGNRVLLRGPNSPWLVACWFAVMKAGGVVVTTMPLLRARELRTICEMVEPVLALSDIGLVDALEAAAPGLRTLTYGGEGVNDLARLAGRQPDQFTNVPTAADDVCMLAFTSGTTGRPKVTVHFHRDVLAITDTFARHLLKPGPGDLFAGSPPIGFTFGLGGLVVFPLRAGAATLLLERAGPEELLDAAGRHGVTTLFTAPTAIRAMLPLLEQCHVGTLRTCVSAGETLPAATWTAFHQLTGVRIIDGLGATEMLHIFVSSTAGEAQPGFTGRAVPGYVAEVQDGDGQPVPDGEAGLLAVKGPTGCRYLHGDRQGEYVRAGWNITGDVYIRDEQGYFRYQARADDMIVSSGYNIAGPEVENALLQHPDVAEVAVVGLPDEDRGALVTAYVVVRPGRPRTTEAARRLQDFVKSEIAPYKYPRRLEFVDELPRSATGKLQRFQLRRRSSE
jgi:acyl-coenzyme A synthetase/AMP-(fatty) acid ligase